MPGGCDATEARREPPGQAGDDSGTARDTDGNFEGAQIGCTIFLRFGQISGLREARHN
jgi:hypothetical protein